jgi:SAM-dependent methyltransferase
MPPVNDAEITVLAHSGLTFNAPLSDARAAELVASLGPLAGTRVVDLGCGWAELLLRVLAKEPTATGAGIDTNAAEIERGSANAATRGLTGRVRFDVGDATAYPDGRADVVLCIGASHAWAGTHQALQAVRPLLRPGGRLLFGDGYWQRPPGPETLAALGGDPGEFGSLAELADLAIDSGYRLLALSTAGTDEWDAFESRWCGGLEQWLLSHPDSPDAARVRAVADEHRRGWLHGYRGTLGFAYLTLAAS